jgi:hypothetical protein
MYFAQASPYGYPHPDPAPWDTEEVSQKRVKTLPCNADQWHQDAMVVLSRKEALGP